MTGEPSRRGRGRPPHPDILTPREWQVLDLLRQGLTNERIAERLDISFATAKYHVAEIISKLGVQTREEAAAWQPEPVALRWWQRATARVPRRAWPLAGAAASLAVLAALTWLVLGTSAGEDGDNGAVSQPSASEAGDAGILQTSASPTPVPYGIRQLAYFGHDRSLWLVNSDGTGKTRITDRCPGAPVWSQQGNRVACSGSSLSFDEIAVFDLNGNELWRTEHGDRLYSFLRISPDGHHIAYRADDGSLHVVDLESTTDKEMQPRALPLGWLSNYQLLIGLNVELGDQFSLPQYDGYLLDIRTLELEPKPYFDDGKRFWLVAGGRRAVVLAPRAEEGIGLATYDLETETEQIIPVASVGVASEGTPARVLSISSDGLRFFAANQLGQPTLIFRGALDGSAASLFGTVPAKAPVHISQDGLVAYCASLSQSPQVITIANLETGTATHVEGSCSNVAWRSVICPVAQPAPGVATAPC